MPPRVGELNRNSATRTTTPPRSATRVTTLPVRAVWASWLGSTTRLVRDAHGVTPAWKSLAGRMLTVVRVLGLAVNPAPAGKGCPRHARVTSGGRPWAPAVFRMAMPFLPCKYRSVSCARVLPRRARGHARVVLGVLRAEGPATQWCIPGWPVTCSRAFVGPGFPLRGPCGRSRARCPQAHGRHDFRLSPQLPIAQAIHWERLGPGEGAGARGFRQARRDWTALAGGVRCGHEESYTQPSVLGSLRRCPAPGRGWLARSDAAARPVFSAEADNPERQRLVTAARDKGQGVAVAEPASGWNEKRGGLRRLSRLAACDIDMVLVECTDRRAHFAFSAHALAHSCVSAAQNATKPLHPPPPLRGSHSSTSMVPHHLQPTTLGRTRPASGEPLPALANHCARTPRPVPRPSARHTGISPQAPTTRGDPGVGSAASAEFRPPLAHRELLPQHLGDRGIA